MRGKRQLKPNTTIHLCVDGFSVMCKVKDIRSQAGIDAVNEINRCLASGEVMTGFGSTFGKHNIQINWQ